LISIEPHILSVKVHTVIVLHHPQSNHVPLWQRQ